MILSGEKKEEYREINPYYTVRFRNIWGHLWSEPHEVCFRNGYRKDSPSFIATVTLSIGYGLEQWGAEQGKKYYILEVKNEIYRC